MHHSSHNRARASCPLLLFITLAAIQPLQAELPREATRERGHKTESRLYGYPASSRSTKPSRSIPRDVPVWRPGHASEKRSNPVLTLSEAVAKVLDSNPRLAATTWELSAAEGRQLQARLRPNPSLSLEVENVGGRLGTFGASESTLAFELPFERGGKWSSRIRLAGAEREVAGWDVRVVRADLIAETRRRFVRVLAAQELLSILEETVAIASRGAATVKDMVEAGSASPVETLRAETVLVTAKIERDQVRQRLKGARLRLAALWGDDALAARRLKGPFGKWDKAPSFQTLKAAIEQNPELARMKTEEDRRRADVALQEAMGRPDPSGIAGVRRLEGDDATTFLVGVSLPLASRNRNQGSIAEAKVRLRQLTDETAAIRTQLLADLAASQAALEAAEQALSRLTSRVLPAARQVLEAIESGYRGGKFTYLDLLDAQKRLADARSRRINFLASYHQSLTDVGRLLGEPLFKSGITTEIHEGASR